MATRKIEGREVEAYETLAEGVQARFDRDFALVEETIRLLTQAIGTSHEAVADLAVYQPERIAHQAVGSAIYNQLTSRYTDLSRAEALRLMAAANPWFKPHLFPKNDRRLDKATETLLGRQEKGPAMAAAKAAEAADGGIPDDFTNEEMDAFIAENRARLARNEKPLRANAWRRLQE